MLSEPQWAQVFLAAKQRGARWTDLADVNAFKREIEAALPALASAPPIAPSRTPPIGQPNKWQAMIDLDLLCIAFPGNSRSALAEWVEPTRAACIRWGIDTVREIASFLANINVESAGLTVLTENLNYSSAALIKLFGRHRISIDEANRYGRGNGHPANQEMLANILYGGEWGRKNLGNTQPGDGWRFRGYSPKQITGRGNWTKFAEAMNLTVDQAVDYARTKIGGMMAAGWFWHSHDLDAKAATPGVEDDRRAINGGTFGLPVVEAGFNRLVDEMLRRET